MDSLLASYASSDEDDQGAVPNQQRQSPAQQQNTNFNSSSSKVSSLFSSLPQPKSSSVFSSLPQPKQPLKTPIDNTNNIIEEEENSKNIPKPTSLFSSLPQPKSLTQQQQQQPQPQAQAQRQQQPISNPKKVVLFRPPIISSASKPADFDDDDEEEEKQRKKRRESQSLAQTPSVKSFLSSIPAPRNFSTLGVMPSSGSGRRSVIETEAPASSNSGENELNDNQNAYDNVNYGTSYPNYASGSRQNAAAEAAAEAYVDYGSYQNYDQNVSDGDVSNCESYYGNYNGDYGQFYGNNWGDVSASGISHTPLVMAGVSDGAVGVQGKRGRNEIPTNVVEVRQDELMKNRPREAQVKLTGIAFGPSYQPVSTKGKPTKLHKRKHQIGSLYYDMKQKETELAERRAQGFLTKAQTQGKYGW